MADHKVTFTIENTKDPIANAEILIDNNTGTTSNKDGYYEIIKLSPGEHTIKVKRLGYIEKSTKVQIKEGQTIRFDFQMIKDKLYQIMQKSTLKPGIPTDHEVAAEYKVGTYLNNDHTEPNVNIESGNPNRDDESDITGLIGSMPTHHTKKPSDHPNAGAYQILNVPHPVDDVRNSHKPRKPVVVKSRFPPRKE